MNKETHRIAELALFLGLIVGVKYALAPLPNFELVSLVFFLSIKRNGLNKTLLLVVCFAMIEFFTFGLYGALDGVVWIISVTAMWLLKKPLLIMLQVPVTHYLVYAVIDICLWRLEPCAYLVAGFPFFVSHVGACLISFGFLAPVLLRTKNDLLVEKEGDLK